MIQGHVAGLLHALVGSEEFLREGLKETPRRVAAAYQEWLAGYQQDPAELLTQFEDGSERYHDIVLVKDIPVHSLCEHHMTPFFGVAHVAYIPAGKIVGLSKLPRLVDCFARRLQVQERITSQVAHALADSHLGALAVGVILRCRHLCMESRGIRQSGAETVTSCMLGAFDKDAAARAELLQLIGRV